MLFKGRKAIELSANFIVVLILSIVVFGFGVWFAYKIYEGSTGLVDTVDTQTQDQLNNMLVADKFAILPTTKEIYNGQTAIFDMAIKNELETGRPEDGFNVEIKFLEAFDNKEVKIGETGVDTNHIIMFSSDTKGKTGTNPSLTKTITIKKNAVQYFKIGIRMKGVKQGTYIFDVNVNGGEYWKGKLYVKVL